MEKEILINILKQADVVKSIEDNLDTLLKLIPEINDMIDFPQNHPHHHLDVWNHTLLALSISPLNFEIRLALLLHDIGKPHSYQDEEVRHFKNHGIVSGTISKNILTRLNFSPEEIESLCYLIISHDELITEKDLKNNQIIAQKRFQIQVCDALAHHPDKLKKRIEHLLIQNEKINSGIIKEIYDDILKNYQVNKPKIKNLSLQKNNN